MCFVIILAFSISIFNKTMWDELKITSQRLLNRFNCSYIIEAASNPERHFSTSRNLLKISLDIADVQIPRKKFPNII